MKTEKQPKSAFTLVEMLVVIAIMSLVAMSVTHAVKGAQRTANATKCQANLKNLHAAVMTYLGDRRGTWGISEDFEKLKGEGQGNGQGTGFWYPRASSYECRWDTWDDGDSAERYYECHGWISWVPMTGKRRDANGKTPWIRDKFKNSHAEKFGYPANTDPKMRDAISEGYLFKYVDKDYATYQCPEHRKFRSTADDKVYFAYLAYAMNSWFRSHADPNHNARTTKSFGSVKVKINGQDKTVQQKPSGMALFIEMKDSYDALEKRPGQSAQRGEERKPRAFGGDGVWEWGDTGKEEARFSHRKGKALYCNVIFVDGHVGAIPNDSEDLSEWNEHKDLKEVYETMHAGAY